MMMKTTLLTLPILLAVTLPFCDQDDLQNYEIAAAETQVRISVAVPTEIEGLTGLTLTLTPALECPGYWEDAEAEGISPWTETLELDDMIYPNGDTVADGPNEYLQQLAEAEFTDVIAGCYTLIAAPEVEGDNQQAMSCWTPEYTVELELGDSLVFDMPMTCAPFEPRPELEVQANNNPPMITEIVVTPQTSACDVVEVCATATDVDFDALEFEWIRPDSLTEGAATTRWPTIISHTINEDDSVTQCLGVQARIEGTHELELNVYDVIRPDPFRGPMRIEDVRGESSRATELAQLDATLGCRNTARSAVILMTLDNNPGMSEDDAKTLIDNTIQWANESPDDKILVLLDDNHHGEDAGDGEYVLGLMEDLGYEPEYMVEPAGGINSAMLESYQLVWFVNPGYEMDDIATHRTLNAYRQTGGALILQGDDIARFRGDPQYMRELTYLSWVGNGTVACGAHIDNNQGESYTVSIDGDGATSHPLTIGLAGKSFEYGNDIDQTRRVDAGEQVLAWATYETLSCVVRTPVIVALDPDFLAPL